MKHVYVTTSNKHTFSVTIIFSSQFYYSYKENPKEREVEGNFRGFDWFPPTLLYSVFDGDLTNTKHCIRWIEKVGLILNILVEIKFQTLKSI